MISAKPIAVRRIFLSMCVLLLAWINPLPMSANELPARKTIVLSGIAESDFSLLMTIIIKEAYSRIGYNAEVVYFPAKRSLVESSTGFVDGEVGRVFRVGERYNTLLRVPSPFMFLKTMVFAKQPDVEVNKKEDLANYSSAILRGIYFSNQLTEGLHRIHGDRMPQLFAMLVANRVDLVITNEVSGRLVIAEKFSNQGIRIEADSLLDIPIYHYLHERNSHIIPLLEPILKEMFESGETARMKEAFIQERILKAQGLN